MILSAQQLSIHFGMRPILQQADFYLEDHDKVGIVGLNGAGKSTLLRLLAGVEDADAGQVILSTGVRRSFLPQRPDMDAEATVLTQVMADARSSAEYECKAMLQRLGLEDYDALVRTLSGGQRKRAALAAALLRPAELLLLDEPTNHLDGESIVWLEEYLRAFRGCIVMVTHDRYFLERVCSRIVEVDRGKLYSYEANYSRYLALKAERLEMALRSLDGTVCPGDGRSGFPVLRFHPHGQKVHRADRRGKILCGKLCAPAFFLPHRPARPHRRGGAQWGG